jgi:hypothetical protein
VCVRARYAYYCTVGNIGDIGNTGSLLITSVLGLADKTDACPHDAGLAVHRMTAAHQSQDC